MKNIYLLLTTTFIFFACGGLQDASKVLRNEKVRTTDEFLVKKRNPLVLPPNYEKIPEPGSLIENKENEEDKIKKILKAPTKEKNLQNKNSSIEDAIINRISK